MGAAMAANLARAGFPLTVWNRTPGRTGSLVELGMVKLSKHAVINNGAWLVLNYDTNGSGGDR